MPTLPEGDWPPSLGRQYTRLAMIERERELPGAELVATMERDYIRGNMDNIVKRKKVIQLREIFLPTEDGEQELKILMDGAPGVGKSTLSRKICKDWANGDLLQQYHLVILLPLRQTSIREATCIEGLIEADDPDLKQKVVRHIQTISGEHVLLILDGYDELSNEDRKQKSLFLELVQGNKFSKCSLLVTSRPYASDYLQQLQSINRHVEVLGFTEKQIENCIIQNIPDKTKATELVETLKERQDIASLCYIPLNCVIVLYVYKMEQCTLPNCLTKLYEIFILNALKRNAIISDTDLIIRRLHTLAKIPESFQKHLNCLCKLAYDGLIADKMAFSIEDISAVFSDCSDHIEHKLLGLMNVFKEFTSTGEELSYQFLHLTIQEFLAATWAASQLSADELLKFFQDHLREKRYRMVLLFLAGISQLKFPSAEHLFSAELDFNSNGEYSNRKVVDYFLFLSHLIYESQNFSLFHNLASTIVGAELFAASYHIAPFDCLVLAHFLALCDCSLKLLDLSRCGLTSESLEIMHRVNLEYHGTTQIEKVKLSNNPKIITKLPLLAKLPMFEHTRVLKACGFQFPLEPSCMVDLLCLLNMRHLTTLKILAKKTPYCHIPTFEQNYLSLDKFRFEDGKINSQNAVNLFRSLEHNTSLKELRLSRNSQLVEGDSEAVGCAIERMLNVNKTLKILNLRSCGFTSEAATNFANGLAHNCSIERVDLCYNQISSTGAASIFRSLEHNTSLKELDLSGNSQLAKGDSEAVGCAIERMLNVNKTLKILNLRGCGFPSEAATNFANGLAHNCSIERVGLCYNQISSTGAASIFRSLEHNTSLKELDLSGNSQLAKGDSEAVGCAVERMLNVNRTLKVLYLRECNVTDSTAEHITAGLTKNTSLVKLDIGLCTLSVSCAVSFFQQMATHPTVSATVGEVGLLGVGKVVMMNRGTMLCTIGEAVPEKCVEFFRALNGSGIMVSKLTVRHLTEQTAEHFAVELAEYKSVQALELEFFNITSAGAVNIFRSLEHNTSLEELKLSVGNSMAVGDTEAVGCAIERMLNVNVTLKVLDLNHYRLDTAVTTSIFRSLEHNTSLEKLDLSPSWLVSAIHSRAVGDSEAVGHAIERTLNTNRTLKVLNLRGCRLDTVVTTHIFRSLEHNTSLEELDLSGNSQLTEGDREAVGCAIERMMNANRTLKVLKLEECELDTAVATHIFRSLENNTSLEKLSLFLNRQLAEGDSEAVGCAIERMLNVNRTLKALELGCCGLDTTVATHIASGLVHNASLAELAIEGNHSITSEGYVHVYKALCNNASMKKLYTNKELTKELVAALVEMLSCNKSLTELSLGCNIPKTESTEIARGLLQNASLQSLYVGGLYDSKSKKSLVAEIERLKTSENIAPQQSSRKLEIKAGSGSMTF